MVVNAMSMNLCTMGKQRHTELVLIERQTYLWLCNPKRMVRYLARHANTLPSWRLDNHNSHLPSTQQNSDIKLLC